jgi:hypothetical protein
MSSRDRLLGAFWSACPQGHVSTCSSVFPAERSGDGALALGQPLAPRAKAESRFACLPAPQNEVARQAGLRTPNGGRLDGICCPSDGLHSFILSLFVCLFAVRRFAPGSQKTPGSSVKLGPKEPGEIVEAVNGGGRRNGDGPAGLHKELLPRYYAFEDPRGPLQRNIQSAVWKEDGNRPSLCELV